MKKLIISVLLLTFTSSFLIGCGSKNTKGDEKVNTTVEATSSKLANFKEKEGLLTYTDTKNSPFENSGLEITIKKGAGGYVNFVKTTLEGKATKDYYKFDFEKNTVEKYYYVSAMGTAYYYDYDLVKEELSKIEDDKHNDKTKSTKESKRWDKAATTMKADVQALEKYFKDQYNVSIKNAVTNK